MLACAASYGCRGAILLRTTSISYQTGGILEAGLPEQACFPPAIWPFWTAPASCPSNGTFPTWSCQYGTPKPRQWHKLKRVSNGQRVSVGLAEQSLCTAHMAMAVAQCSCVPVCCLRAWLKTQSMRSSSSQHSGQAFISIAPNLPLCRAGGSISGHDLSTNKIDKKITICDGREKAITGRLEPHRQQVYLACQDLLLLPD